MNPEPDPDETRPLDGSALHAPGSEPAAPVPPTRRRYVRPLLIGGLVVALVGGGVGGAVAATQSPSPSATPSASPSASPSGTPSPGTPSSGGPSSGGPGRQGPDWGFGFHLGGGDVLGALHGQLVVPGTNGGDQTVDVQSGQVTAVSSTSVTLKSSDGFTQTYTVTSSTIVDAQRDGISSVKVGDQAWLIATAGGGTPTVTSLADLSNLKTSHPNRPFGRHGQKPTPPSAPTSMPSMPPVPS